MLEEFFDITYKSKTNIDESIYISIFRNKHKIALLQGLTDLNLYTVDEINKFFKLYISICKDYIELNKKFINSIEKNSMKVFEIKGMIEFLDDFDKLDIINDKNLFLLFTIKRKYIKNT